MSIWVGWGIYLLVGWAIWAFGRWMENRSIERRAYYRARGYKAARSSKPAYRLWWRMHK